jgi:peptidoglycan/LPS O-acetylase OafA/YrhL
LSSSYQPPSGKSGPRSYIPELDGIRAIATVMVICFHFWQSFTSGPYSVVGKIAVWGQTGVDLFFVLSGFLITGILLDSRQSPNFLRNFYARRFLRIFPLYYGALAVFYIGAPLLRLAPWVDISKSVWFWLYLQNIPLTFFPASAVGPNHFWSLAVEEQFYLAWPLIVLATSRKTLLRIIGAAVVISVLTRAALPHYATFYFTVARVDGLAIGAGIAILWRDRGRLTSLVRFARCALFIIGPLMVGAQLVMSGSHNFALQVVKSTLISLVYGSVLVLVTTKTAGRLVERTLSATAMRSIGRYSYGMYVIHPFLLGWFRSLGLPYGVAGLLLTVTATYLAAMICWHAFEKRFLQFKSHFDYRQAAPPRKDRPMPAMALVSRQI